MLVKLWKILINKNIFKYSISDEYANHLENKERKFNMFGKNYWTIKDVAVELHYSVIWVRFLLKNKVLKSKFGEGAPAKERGKYFISCKSLDNLKNKIFLRIL